MPDPGAASAAWCAAILALAGLALTLPSGRVSKATVAWIAVMLVGALLAIVWM